MAILPIYTFGDDVLRKEAVDLNHVDSKLDRLISDMFETMYQADGIGLAAPQIGQSINLFLVDITQTREGQHTEPMVIINPQILEESGSCSMEEGCLSVPNINDFVERPEHITLKYRDAKFNERIESFSGLHARVIQHEFDHLLGTLFVDHLSPFKRSFLKNKLKDIQRGKVDVEYILAGK